MRGGRGAVSFVAMSNDPAGSDHPAVRVPPPLVAVLTMVSGYGLERVVPLATATTVPPLVRYGLGGFIVAASVAVLSVWPIILFRRSGQDPTPWTPAPELLVEGPYRFTRNPMYLMMLLVCAGASLLLASLWILLLTPLCAVIIHRTAIRHEEAYLERRFGERYRRYRDRVRRWI